MLTQLKSVTLLGKIVLGEWFINLFYPKNKKEVVLRLYQYGEEKSIYEEESVLRETITHSTVFTFKKHLRGI